MKGVCVQGQVTVGKLGGARIGLHYSWFLIAFLITISLGWHFDAVHPEWNETGVWAAAVITAALFFAGILLTRCRTL